MIKASVLTLREEFANKGLPDDAESARILGVLSEWFEVFYRWQNDTYYEVTTALKEYNKFYV